jgi:ferritin-like metal-binding protein YciE
MASWSVREFFFECLRELYDIEKKLAHELPHMTHAASSHDLRNAFQHHLEETRGQIERLEDAFDLLDLAKHGKHSCVIEALIEEGRDMVDEIDEKRALDLGLAVAARTVQHVEIATYRSVITLANVLGHTDIARLLAESLAEEEEADGKFAQILEQLALDSPASEGGDGVGQPDRLG